MNADHPEADSDQRAFTGHPDHPPEEPDQSLEANEELRRGPGGQDSSESEDPGKKPGDGTSTLPGYG